MNRVNIKIGSVVFDRADYDAEHDVLYLHVGEPQEADGEETPEGHVVRYAPGTQRIVGLTLLAPARTLKDTGHVAVTLPETVEKRRTTWLRRSRRSNVPVSRAARDRYGPNRSAAVSAISSPAAVTLSRAHTA